MMANNIVEVNANNIGVMDSEDILNFFCERYRGLKVPDTIEFFELTKIEHILSYLANERSYLNYLLCAVDIQARRYKMAKLTDEHTLAVCKKEIIKAYKDSLETMSNTISRMITIYQLEKEQERYENKLSQIGA